MTDGNSSGETDAAGRDGLRYPFMPYGLVPLVGLLVLMVVALGPFAFGEVQAVTGASARQALADVGANWAEADISGQWVTLEGRPPSREAADAAIAAVKKRVAPTLFGDAAPATMVIDHFTWAEDQLQAGGPNRPVIGGVRPADEPAPPPMTDEQIAACDKAMGGLLNSTTIAFSTASTHVSGDSSELLDRVADAAKACPGVLRIEGHTDNIGLAAANADLSRRRANAVRAALMARGVPPKRLVAEGFGATKPVADNATADGRARNRRIEIHPVRPDGPT